MDPECMDRLHHHLVHHLDSKKKNDFTSKWTKLGFGEQNLVIVCSSMAATLTKFLDWLQHQ
jgi:hypothetical protein